jgi:hypothetical protein
MEYMEVIARVDELLGDRAIKERLELERFCKGEMPDPGGFLIRYIELSIAVTTNKLEAKAKAKPKAKPRSRKKKND